MKVIITGSEGYIGRRLEEKLRELGQWVIGIDKASLFPSDVCYLTGLPDADAVVHLAGVSHEPTAQYDPKGADELNHLATERMAKLAIRGGIRKFIFASTCSIYFTWDTPVAPKPYKETDPVNPVSAYSLSKRAAEQSLLSLAYLHNFEPVIFRFGTVYGASPVIRVDTVVQQMVRDIKYRKKVFVHAKGKIWRPLADIEDVVWGIIKALELPEIGGQIFNLSTDNWNIKDLAERIRDILDPRAKVEVQQSGSTRNYLADVSKFKQTFNWQPQRTFEEAIKELWQKI